MAQAEIQQVPFMVAVRSKAARFGFLQVLQLEKAEPPRWGERVVNFNLRVEMFWPGKGEVRGT